MIHGGLIEVHVPFTSYRDYPISEWPEPFAEHADDIPHIELI